MGQWPGGFQAEVQVAAGSQPITAWTVTWTFPNGQQVQNSWNATIGPNGAGVAASNVGYNGSLAAGASTTFGFLGSWSGTNSPPTNLSCTAS
jgi:cellulase/cellobiase CelA1